MTAGAPVDEPQAQLGSFCVRAARWGLEGCGFQDASFPYSQAAGKGARSQWRAARGENRGVASCIHTWRRSSGDTGSAGFDRGLRNSWLNITEDPRTY